jgi:hypothetical protein
MKTTGNPSGYHEQGGFLKNETPLEDKACCMSEERSPLTLLGSIIAVLRHATGGCSQAERLKYDLLVVKLQHLKDDAAYFAPEVRRHAILSRLSAIMTEFMPAPVTTVGLGVERCVKAIIHKTNIPQ